MNEFDKRKELSTSAASKLQKQKEDELIYEQVYYERISIFGPFSLGLIFLLIPLLLGHFKRKSSFFQFYMGDVIGFNFSRRINYFNFLNLRTSN